MRSVTIEQPRVRSRRIPPPRDRDYRKAPETPVICNVRRLRHRSPRPHRRDPGPRRRQLLLLRSAPRLPPAGASIVRFADRRADRREPLRQWRFRDSRRSNTDRVAEDLVGAAFSHDGVHAPNPCRGGRFQPVHAGDAGPTPALPRLTVRTVRLPLRTFPAVWIRAPDRNSSSSAPHDFITCSAARIRRAPCAQLHA